jgi:hypothetical protein
MVEKMEAFLKKLFFENFKRKVFSLAVAIVIWMVVSSSITTTHVFPRIPVRVVNLPPNKTIRGLTPDGFMERKITVTLTGTKEVLDRIGPNDFEVVIDASNKGDEWVAQIGTKNLVSLNPDVEFVNAIQQVSYSEFIIRLCRLVTDRIPVFVLPPKGQPPEGYQFLDVWPQKLYQNVSGAEEDLKQLQEEGIELTFDLSLVSREELDSLRSEGNDDEVSFFVPESWKKVRVPFPRNSEQVLNCPEARQLRIDFLHKDLLSVEGLIPLRIFYPFSTIDVFNPTTLQIRPSKLLKTIDDVLVVNKRLFASDVSRLFLDIVRDRIEIVLVPLLRDNTVTFRTDVQFIDPQQLEEAYVTIALSSEMESDATFASAAAVHLHLVQREHYLRSRFREYLRRFRLYSAKDVPFSLAVATEGNAVTVDEVE